MSSYHPSMYQSGKLLPMQELSDVLQQLELSLSKQRQLVKEKETELECKVQEIKALKSRLEQLESVIYAKTELSKENRPKNQMNIRMAICGDVTNDKVELPFVEKPASAIQLVKSAFAGKSFLTHLSDNLLGSLIDCMEQKIFKPEEFVIKEGDKGDCFYVIESGSCVILKEDPAWTQIIIGESTLIGELAILYNCSRTASIKAMTNVTTWFLKRNVYHHFMRENFENSRIVNSNFLLSITLFKNLPQSKLMKIVDALHEVYYSDQDVIVRQGEKGDKFYIIKKGFVYVSKSETDSKSETIVAKLEEGSTFGEKALLSTDIRTATVTASGNVTCLALNAETFKFLVGEVGDEHSFGTYESTAVSDLSDERNKEDFTYFHLSDLVSEKIIGAGAFGKVEQVLCTKDMKRYALKSMSKAALVKYNQVEHVYNEKKILMRVNCYFIYTLHQAFQDDQKLYLLLELFTKPDVFRVLRHSKVFDEKASKFCAACVIEAFNYLHERNIVYRDLKPENLAFDENGYVKLIDMGFAKYVSAGSKTYTFCGTTEYLAPEIFWSKGHDHTVDFWGLGILIYEFLVGNTPFYSNDPDRILEKIQRGIEYAPFPRTIPITALMLIKDLCRQDPCLRIGNRVAGYQEIRKHIWFFKFSWETLQDQTMPPPKFDWNVEKLEITPEELPEECEDEGCGDVDWDKVF